jgi:uncharacterized Fe-S center protein
MQTVTLIPTESIQALAQQLDLLLDNDLEGKEIAIKLHMGEYGNLHYLRPPLVGRVVEVLKAKGARPFLFDTPTWYQDAPRSTAQGYLDTARRNGFTQETIGCPVLITDQYETVGSSLRIGDVSVPRKLLEADGLLVLSHFKGHSDASFGGCIKNIGMGCVAPSTKEKIHKSLSRPVVDDEKCTQCLTCVEKCPAKALALVDEAISLNRDRCWGCGTCGEVCPEGAIGPVVANMRELIAEAASVVLGPFAGRPTLFVNVLLDITELCDCCDLPGRRIADDIGYLISDSPVAVDKASLDLINQQQGKNCFEELFPVKSMVQLEVGQQVGLGDLEYGLVRVDA